MLDLPFRTAGPTLAPPAQTPAFSSRLSLEGNPAQIAVFRKIEREGLVKPPGSADRNDLERKIDAAFAPKILHAGSVRIYSPIVTAIARKNPLCLIDPMFLGISF
jgi:hypothetical protein